MTKYLRDIAHARSGDKGLDANIGVMAFDEEGYQCICSLLTQDAVRAYFERLKVEEVTRYELPKLLAVNFVLKNALAGGGSRSLRSDSQGKALAQALLEYPIYD